MVLSTRHGDVGGRWIASALVVVVAIGLTSAWFMTRTDGARLYESVWELESARYEGSPVSVETNDAPVMWVFNRICDSGAGTGPGCTNESSLTVRGGCGWHSTLVVNDGGTISWTGDAREIAPGCVGPITRALIAVGGSGSFAYSIDGERLVVTAPDDSATLVFHPLRKVDWGP